MVELAPSRIWVIRIVPFRLYEADFSEELFCVMSGRNKRNFAPRSSAMASSASRNTPPNALDAQIVNTNLPRVLARLVKLALDPESSPRTVMEAARMILLWVSTQDPVDPERQAKSAAFNERVKNLPHEERKTLGRLLNKVLRDPDEEEEVDQDE
jgi:hypothetical protein